MAKQAQRKFSKCHYLTTQLRGAFHLCQQTSNSKLCMKQSFPHIFYTTRESVDVASCSQLLVFVRYVHIEDDKEEFLYCNVLKITATVQDAMDSISEIFETEGLQWEKLCGVCMDGAPAMLGSKSGFQIKVKEKSPQVKEVHCMMYSFDFKKFFQVL